MLTTGDTVKIMGGVNQLQAYDLGSLVMVGMTPTKQALQHYRSALHSAVILGGAGHIATRRALANVERPYKIQVEIAYEKRIEN